MIKRLKIAAIATVILIAAYFIMSFYQTSSGYQTDDWNVINDDGAKRVAGEYLVNKSLNQYRVKNTTDIYRGPIVDIQVNLVDENDNYAGRIIIDGSTGKIASSDLGVAKSDLAGKITEQQMNALRNSEYYLLAYGKTILLKNGSYFEKYEGRDAGIRAGIFNNLATVGDLDGDGEEEAAVILDSFGGGTGHFYELAIMRLNRNNTFYYITSDRLGDRVIIESLAMKSGNIIIDMIAHGPDEGLCCPTVRTISKYLLYSDKLLKV